MEVYVRARDERASADIADAELLAQLRAGESDAYAELWRRHSRSALRVARRLNPDRAEDLVSESFLAVYHQVTVTGNGPETAFRPYLFATIRNTAIRWGREANLVESDPDVDEIDFEDGLSVLEDEARATEVLEAFEALPERWQRVLWLTEVEEAKRADIASEFGIKPNAVSALYRRARTGLREQWLLTQIPADLRDSPEHIARMLPGIIVKRTSASTIPDVTTHLRDCAECATLESELRNTVKRMHRNALSVAGLAAIGLTLPATQAAPLIGVGVGAGSASVGASSGGIAAIAASVTVIAVGGAITSAALLSPAPANEAPIETRPETSHDVTGTTEIETTAEQVPAELDEPVPPAPTDPPLLGRGNDNQDVQSYFFGTDAEPNDFYVRPLPPEPAPPGSIPPPTAEPIAALHPGITTSPEITDYLAPVLTGTTTPGAQVAIKLIRPSLAPVPVLLLPQFNVQADDAGNWSFDLRALSPETVGDYTYQVWAFTDTETSAVETGGFSLLAPEVTGFESLAFGSTLPILEASSTGIVFEARGPASGTVCLSSVYSGQSVELPLDDTGSTVKRIRFLTGGTYLLNFRVCADSHRGPSNYVFVDVDDPDLPIFGPWGPDPSETVFELMEPDAPVVH